MAVNSASAAPTSGKINVAFIMAEFNDQDFQDEYDQDYFEDTAFASTNSMWDYFDEVSKGALNIEGNVYGHSVILGECDKNLITWIEEVQARGAGEIILTSVDNDGMECGYDLTLIKLIIKSSLINYLYIFSINF